MKMSNNFILKSRLPSIEIPNKSVGEILWERLQEFDENLICFIDARNDTKLTVGEFKSQVNSIAMALLKRGVTKSDTICCSSTNTIENALISFTAHFLGLTLVPLSPTFTNFELKKEIQNSGTTIIFTSAKKAPHFEGIAYDSNQSLVNKQIKLVFVFDGSYGNFASFSQLLKEGKDKKLEKIPHFEIDPKNDIFMLIYSSGTTGLPKCAIYKHHMVVAMLTDSKVMTHSLKGITISGHYPLGHVSGFSTLLRCISLGATIVLSGEYNEDFILKYVEKYRITYLPLFPNFAHKLIEGELVDKYDLSSVKLMFTAGAPVPEYVVRGIFNKYKVQFREAYAMTEYIPISSSFCKDINEYIPGNVGFISANTELKIIDLNSGQSLGPNIDGEICVRGPKMFSGYLNNESATQEMIDKEGWLHTGDIGHYDQNERLFITDRLKEVIKIGVVTIAPNEIELFLLTHESVEEVAVVGVKHKTETQSPRAYVKVRKGTKVSEEELKKFVADNMASTKQLKAGVIFVDHIQRTSIGKIDRKYFKNLVKDEIIG